MDLIITCSCHISETPTFEERPQVTVKANQTEDTVSVYCTFHALTAVGLQYQVMWYVNDTQVKVDDIGNNTVSVLAESLLGVLSLDSEVCTYTIFYHEFGK